MVQIALIGLGAGSASALLFASVASGSLISILLFYLAPLPILIAAIGWSHWAALIAAVAAAIGLAVALDSFFFLAFLLGVGLPAWWLGYLALLARPVTGGTSDLDWFPIGRLVLWAAVLGTLVVVAAIPVLGTDADSFHASLRRGFEVILQRQSDGAAGKPGDSQANYQRVLDLLVIIVPPAAAVLSTLVNVVNLWLAGRVVQMSGRLRRPWPDLSALRLPPRTPLLLGLAVAGTFLPGLAGIIAGVLAATLLMAYAVAGFAVLHAITRATATRGLVLAGTYTAVIILGWPVLLMTLFGLVDAFIDLRARAARKGGPPRLT